MRRRKEMLFVGLWSDTHWYLNGDYSYKLFQFKPTLSTDFYTLAGPHTFYTLAGPHTSETYGFESRTNS
jgi:hypothetical protein